MDENLKQFVELYNTSDDAPVEPAPVAMPEPVVHQDQFHAFNDPMNSAPEIVTENYHEVQAPPPVVGGYATSEDIDAMKKILTSFTSAAESTVEDIKHNSMSDSFLDEAIHTRVSDNNITIKDYEIRIKIVESKNGKDKKVYDVVDSNGRRIANDLYLYEAAYAIVKLLNRGHLPLSNDIRHIVGLEEKYYSARSDALQFKRRYQELVESRDSNKADIYSSRYDKARSDAMSIKKELKRILESL